MRNLSKDWLTNGLVDFEYKKYIILSYLKCVQQQFSDKKLYPDLSHLIDHLQDLKTIKEKKLSVERSFPKSIDRFDLKNFVVHYRKKFKDSDLLNELDSIIEFGLLVFDEHVQVGNEIAIKIKEAITIEPIGITPIYKDEGYFLITEGDLKEVRIFKYTISPIKGLEDSHESIKSFYLGKRKKSISNTLENMKKEVMHLDRKLPNPATYSIHSRIICPFRETYLPIAKQLLQTQLAA